MLRLRAIVVLGLAFLVVLPGSAGAKFMIELSSRMAEPGSEVKIRAGWGAPVGPVQRLRLYLVASEDRLGNEAEIAERHGPGSSRRQVLVLEAAPNQRRGLRATFTVPQVPSGRYAVDVCVSEQECFPYGRFRVTDSAFEEYVPKANGAGDLPTNGGSTSAIVDGGSSLGTVTQVAAAVVIVVLGSAVLAFRRIARRRAA